MSISSIGGIQASAPQRPDPSQMKAGADKAMAPTAELLGMNTDELRSALQDGSTTLAALAEEKGIAREDLLASIEAGLQASPPPGMGNVGVDFSAMAESIADGKAPGGGPRGSGGPPPPPREAGQGVADAASLLNVDASSLLAQLQSGEISSLLSASNVSASTLSATLGGVRLDTYA
jgi:hypothetical protein